jgi:hypothetical protein
MAIYCANSSPTTSAARQRSADQIGNDASDGTGTVAR